MHAMFDNLLFYSILMLLVFILIRFKIENQYVLKVIPSSSENGNVLFYKIRDELRNLGEDMIDGKDIFCRDYLVCSSPEGPGQIKMSTMGKDDYISVHVSIDLYSIGELYRKAFLGERKDSICLIPGRGNTADPRKVAMDFHQLSSEINDVYVFLTGIEVRAKEAKITIDKEVANKKAEVDRRAKDQIVMLLKPQAEAKQ
jgi:hypothetical protein